MWVHSWVLYRAGRCVRYHHNVTKLVNFGGEGIPATRPHTQTHIHARTQATCFHAQTHVLHIDINDRNLCFDVIIFFFLLHPSFQLCSNSVKSKTSSLNIKIWFFFFFFRYTQKSQLVDIESIGTCMLLDTHTNHFRLCLSPSQGQCILGVWCNGWLVVSSHSDARHYSGPASKQTIWVCVSLLGLPLLTCFKDLKYMSIFILFRTAGWNIHLSSYVPQEVSVGDP